MNEWILLTYEFGLLGANGSVSVTARLKVPAQDQQGETCNVTLSFKELDQLRADPEAYRALLTAEFFKDRAIDRLLVKARTVQEERGFPLHIRFEIPKESVRLHGVMWELLGDPARDGAPALGRGERVFFSRYILPGQSPAAGMELKRLKSVALIANPRFLGKDNPLPFAAIDVQREAAVVRELLEQPTELQILTGAQASCASLFACLSAGCDILYLVCHGQLVEDKPVIYLEKSGGEADVLSAEAVVERLGETKAPRPRLVVMASCQSAGGGALSEREDRGFLSSFGARLLQAGVPAVVGMQGKVEIATSRAFVAKLFAGVIETGQIAGAVSMARAEVQGHAHWWMPVLLSSSIGEKLWETRPPFVEWNKVVNHFKQMHLVAGMGADAQRKLRSDAKRPIPMYLPILGRGIVEGLSNWDFANYLRSKMQKDPLLSGRVEPSRIAQVYEVLKNLREHGGIEGEWREFVDTTIRAGLPPVPGETLDELICRWSKSQGIGKTNRVLRMIADLPVPVFLTTNGDSLLQQALRECASPKEPETEILPWWEANFKKVQDMKERTAVPPCSHPLVHHMFGHYDEEGSLAITEDHFFDYLIWLGTYRQGVWVHQLFCNSHLLFLGFSLEDWEFRLLLRIVKRPGFEIGKNRMNIAVQIEDTGEVGSRDKVQQQLENYFRHTSVSLNIFWGTAEQFLSDLHRRLGPTPNGVEAS